MAIKSLNELLEMQKSLEETIKLREHGNFKSDQIEILVGMATCGIASGAKETYDKLKQLIKEKQIKNVNVVSVGCVGYCSMEPTLQVCKTGREPILYGKITEDKASDFLNAIIDDNNKFSDSQVTMAFNKEAN